MTLFHPQVDAWVEPFAGSAAMALCLEADHPPPFVYQGGKSRLTDATLHALGLRPGGRARRYFLNDLNPVCWFYSVLRDHGDAVARVVADLPTGRAGFELITGLPVATSDIERAAHYAALQAGVALGKPPIIVNDRWKTAGYSDLSRVAVEKGFTTRLNPPILARRLRRVAEILGGMDVTFTSLNATEFMPPQVSGRRIAYFDPPYRNTTGYRHQATRAQVLATIPTWSAAGYLVAVAEGEILGAEAMNLKQDQGAPLARGRSEYLTLIRPV